MTAPRLLAGAARGALAGALAGFASLALEAAIAHLGGTHLHLRFDQVVAYPIGGGALGLLAGPFVRSRVVGIRADATTAALVLTGLQGVSAFELLYRTFLHVVEVGTSVSLGVGAAAAALYLGAAGLLVRTTRRSRHPGAALAVAGGIGVAVLGTLRNAFESALEPRAVVFAAGLLAAAMGWALQARGRARLGWGTAAVGLAAALWMLRADPGAGREPVPVQSAAASRVNLVLVVIDTLRWDVFHAVLASTEEGRAFRRNLQGAAWFEQAIAASPWTAPSMGSIMTGRYPPEHGLERDEQSPLHVAVRELAPRVPTLARTLRRSGYRTEAVVANDVLHQRSGIARGFARYELLRAPTWKLPLVAFAERLEWIQPVAYQQAEHVTERFAERLPELRSGERPFFAWLHYMDPHAPLRAHRSLAAEPEAADRSVRERLYRQEVRYTLREVRRAIEALQRHGLWDRTAFVFTSDHGEMFPSDDAGRTRPAIQASQSYGHGHALYEELLRVPLVIRPPGGLAEDRVVRALVSHVDLAGAALALLSEESAEAGLSGKALGTWLRSPLDGRPPEEHRYVLAGSILYGPDQRAVRTSRYKLIEYPESGRTEELYDLRADPGETRNLSARRAAVEMRGLLRKAWSALDPVETRSVEVDEEGLGARLRALGYVE